MVQKSKKILFLFFTIVCFLSCDCEWGRVYCKKCFNPINNCICYNNYNGSSSDYFSANTLVGEWQMSNVANSDNSYMRECKIIPKNIKFDKQPIGKFGKCTITYSIGKEPQWYESDYEYNYVRRELSFYRNNEKVFVFTFNNFLFPTLTLKGAYDVYEWRKVR